MNKWIVGNIFNLKVAEMDKMVFDMLPNWKVHE